MRARSALRILALLPLLPACDAGGAGRSLQITGDTLIYAAKFVLPDGQENANCGYRLIRRFRGGRGDTAIIKQGRVTYSFLETNMRHGTWDWTPERLPTIWKDPRITGGQVDTSLHHDIAFSLPFQQIKGEVVFDYTVAGDSSLRSTAPFTFTCR
jgi:hypothetical protein